MAFGFVMFTVLWDFLEAGLPSWTLKQVALGAN